MTPSRPTASDDRGKLFQSLVDLVYEAVLERRLWQRFAEDLSAVFGGAPVSLWMELPGTRSPPERYSARIGASLEPGIEALFANGRLPASKIEGDAATSFRLLGGDAAGEEPPARRSYRKGTQPRVSAPAPPLVHVFATQDGRVLAAVAIHRAEGSPPFTQDDFDFANRLAPHLRRAYQIRSRLLRLERGREVFAEVLDRLPTGILVLDGTGKTLACNRAAELSLEGGSWLRLEGGRLVAADPEENGRLQALILNALVPDVAGDPDARNAMRITVDAAGSQLPIFIRPLLSAPVDGARSEAAAVIFFAAPIWKQDAVLASIRSLYGFTRAEAEIAQLLCQGLSLEEVAARRGVKLSTARSQLKSAFAKTGAKRQGDLVRIVLGGTASHQG